MERPRTLREKLTRKDLEDAKEKLKDVPNSKDVPGSYPPLLVVNDVSSIREMLREAVEH